jgi:ribonuclease BN (tRNA processing enzyme)
MAQGTNYGICPQKKKTIFFCWNNARATTITKNIHLMTDDKKPAIKFSSTPMSHDVRCIGLLLQQPEEALSKSIAKSEPNSGIS